MEVPKKQQLEALDKTLMEDLEEAAQMKLGLSSEDSDYDLPYIGDKLAKVASYMERLSDMQMRHTKIHLLVQETLFSIRDLRGLKERQLKATDTYGDLTASQKGHWIDEQVKDLREATDVWLNLTRTVSEVRRQVLERIEAMRRLESSIRLQSKLLETKVAVGATSIGRIPGAHRKGDLDMNL